MNVGKGKGFYPSSVLVVKDGESTIGQLNLYDWSRHLPAAQWLTEHAPCIGANGRISREGASGWNVIGGDIHPQHGDLEGGRVHCVTRMVNGEYMRGFTFFGVQFDDAVDLTTEELDATARRAGVRYYVVIPGMQVPSPLMARVVRKLLDAGVKEVQLDMLKRAVAMEQS